MINQINKKQLVKMVKDVLLWVEENPADAKEIQNKAVVIALNVK